MRCEKKADTVAQFVSISIKELVPDATANTSREANAEHSDTITYVSAAKNRSNSFWATELAKSWWYS